MKHKAWIAVVLLAVVLHYAFVAAMSSKVSLFTQSFLVLLTLCGALVVWVVSEFGEGER